MRVLFVSDLHYALKQYDWLMAQASHFEVVAIGGDLLDLGAALSYDVQIAVVEEYLWKLSAKCRVLVCSGNHDGDRCDASEESVAGWLHDAKCGGLSVDFDHVHLGDTLVTICPWSSGPTGRLNVKALIEEGAEMEKSRWIWIHHAPPDKTRVSWNGRRHMGDDHLNDLIRAHRPQVVLSGHIHNAPFYPDGSWADQMGATWLMNPGRQMGPAPSFIVLDLDDMSASWASFDDQGSLALGAAG